ALTFWTVLQRCATTYTGRLAARAAGAPPRTASAATTKVTLMDLPSCCHRSRPGDCREHSARRPGGNQAAPTVQSRWFGRSATNVPALAPGLPRMAARPAAGYAGGDHLGDAMNHIDAVVHASTSFHKQQSS